MVSLLRMALVDLLAWQGAESCRNQLNLLALKMGIKNHIVLQNLLVTGGVNGDPLLKEENSPPPHTTHNIFPDHDGRGCFTVFFVKEGLNLSPIGLLTISEQDLNCEKVDSLLYSTFSQSSSVQSLCCSYQANLASTMLAAFLP